jgi:prepilin signal peptidase PulO-like enzyme (type II secretory pathway)
MTYLVIAAFVAILASLGAALFFMMRGSGSEEQKNNRMARALALRVGFSIFIFLTILLSWWMGWIQPTGIQPGQ